MNTADNEEIQIGIDEFPDQVKKLEEQRLAQAPPAEPQAKIEISPDNEILQEKEVLLVSKFTERHQLYGRALSFCVILVFLIMGRFSVPDNEVKAIDDKAFDILEPITRFLIATPGNEIYRDFFQVLCSLLMDIVFITTLGYYVLYGKTTRIMVSLGIFYITRALVQKLFWTPFPTMFYWYDPGILSIVVPYGRGSDFFFSGHSGFLVICANEWHRLGKKKMRNFVLLVLLDTVMTLLIYRVHYSIDIFAGVFFADWCFHKVDLFKNSIDKFFGNVAGGVQVSILKVIKRT